MSDVWIPTCDGRWLVLPCCTKPAKDLQVLMENCRCRCLLSLFLASLPTLYRLRPLL
jgi:hypothetical protein